MVEIEICNEAELKNMIHGVADFIKEIIGRENSKEMFGMIGIKRRGEILANRIKHILTSTTGTPLETGYLDITLFMDLGFYLDYI